MFRWFLLLLVFPMLAPMLSAGEFRFQRQLMGTRFTIVVHAGDQPAAETAAGAAFALAEKIEAMASDYRPDSELSLLAAKPPRVAISLSPELYELLEHCQRMASATDGAFDPSLGPLTKLWRQTRDRKQLPDPAILRNARAASGWRNFSLAPEGRALTLRQADMAFDLGGVAKGYAADRMLESLAKAGFPRSMVSAGGDIRVGDAPPGKVGWRIALQTFDLAHPDEVITLANAAVSTSGDLHQWVEIDGIRYSHILDPATGLGLTRRIAVSVVATEAKLSDPLATAACVLGPDKFGPLRAFPGVKDIKIRTLQSPAEGPDSTVSSP